MGAFTAILTERVVDHEGTFLWEDERPFAELPRPGKGVLRAHILYEVISSTIEGSGVLTVVRRTQT